VLILGPNNASGVPTGGQNIGAPTGAYADSGYQYEGLWRGYTGTVIGPNAFITALHIGGLDGLPFVYQGQTYYTTGNATIPGAPDLVVWYVDRTFPQWAPLYSGNNDEVGKTIVMYGHGGPPGGSTSPDTNQIPLHGWLWLAATSDLSWGANVVSATGTVPGLNGNYLTWNLSRGLSTGSDTGGLSAGDSGGGVFIQSNGVWYLDGVNSAADGLYNSNPAPSSTQAYGASLWDTSNVYFDGDNTPLIGASGSYASQISSVYAEIEAAIPEPGTLPLALVLVAIALPVYGSKRWRRRRLPA
jgi:hypothetical protein